MNYVYLREKFCLNIVVTENYECAGHSYLQNIVIVNKLIFDNSKSTLFYEI